MPPPIIYMILKIKKFNEPVLRQRAKEIKRIDHNVRRLAFNMIKTMDKNRGLGLASNQVGVLERIIAVRTGKKSVVLINPRITKKSKKRSILEEGCLSFPEIFLYISRPEEIELEAEDIKARKVRIKAKGIMSHVYQHEIDHLNGKLFFDRLRLLEKIKFKFKKKWK